MKQTIRFFFVLNNHTPLPTDYDVVLLLNQLIKYSNYGFKLHLKNKCNEMIIITLYNYEFINYNKLALYESNE